MVSQDHDLSSDARAYIASLADATDRVIAREYAVMDDQRFRAHHGLGLDRAVRDAADIKAQVQAANTKLDLVIQELRKPPSPPKPRSSIGRKSLGAMAALGAGLGGAIMHMLKVSQ